MNKNWNKILLSFVLVLTLAVFAIPTAPVFADPGDGNGNADLAARLEQGFAREKDIQVRQEARLAKAEEVIAKTQAYIDKEKAAGYDTSALEAALADFKAVRDENAALSAEAAALIGSHAGFDADGKVSDVQQARKTVKEIGKLQRRFHINAVEASLDLRDALREYRELNHPRNK